MIPNWRVKSYMEHFGQLKGAEIIDFHMVSDSHDKHNAWPTFTMRKGNNIFSFVLSQDEEGNGGGFAFIEKGVR
jgi:hypothetical protein